MALPMHKGPSAPTSPRGQRSFRDGYSSLTVAALVASPGPPTRSPAPYFALDRRLLPPSPLAGEVAARDRGSEARRRCEGGLGYPLCRNRLPRKGMQLRSGRCALRFLTSAADLDPCSSAPCLMSWGRGGNGRHTALGGAAHPGCSELKALGEVAGCSGGLYKDSRPFPGSRARRKGRADMPPPPPFPLTVRSSDGPGHISQTRPCISSLSPVRGDQTRAHRNLLLDLSSGLVLSIQGSETSPRWSCRQGHGGGGSKEWSEWSPASAPRSEAPLHETERRSSRKTRLTLKKHTD